jgi:hypothetical protein
MSDCQNRSTADFLRIDEAAMLEDVANADDRWPHVTRALANLHGFELVPKPSAVMPEGVWSEMTAALLRRAGDMITEIGKALATDNEVDRDEAAMALRKADDLVTCAIGLQQALKRRAEGLA